MNVIIQEIRQRTTLLLIYRNASSGKGNAIKKKKKVSILKKKLWKRFHKQNMA